MTGHAERGKCASSLLRIWIGLLPILLPYQMLNVEDLPHTLLQDTLSSIVHFSTLQYMVGMSL